jgi:hypothetical protein
VPADEGPLAGALAARAAAAPAAPFLFFRGPRGTFTWWSWARARAESVAPGESGAEEGDAPAARDYLRRLISLAGADADVGVELLAEMPAPPERPIWLTTGGLARPVDRSTAAAALAGGWAIVLEPGGEIHPETFAWARPTVVAGAAAELEALLASFAALAPRGWRHDRWLARRSARLRALVVGVGEPVAELAARVDEIRAPAVVLSIRGGGW